MGLIFPLVEAMHRIVNVPLDTLVHASVLEVWSLLNLATWGWRRSLDRCCQTEGLEIAAVYFAQVIVEDQRLHSVTGRETLASRMQPDYLPRHHCLYMWLAARESMSSLTSSPCKTPESADPLAEALRDACTLLP